MKSNTCRPRRLRIGGDLKSMAAQGPRAFAEEKPARAAINFASSARAVIGLRSIKLPTNSAEDPEIKSFRRCGWAPFRFRRKKHDQRMSGICKHTFWDRHHSILAEWRSARSGAGPANADPRTTKLYDRRKDTATLSEIEQRIAFERMPGIS
jgi:hypothetical protein